MHIHRRFRLNRVDDVSGVSGTGFVAEGVEFSNGMVALSFIGPFHGVETWTSLKEMKNVHGHGGKTRVVFLDEDPTQEDSTEEIDK